MALQSTTKIYINGTEIPAFQRIILHQQIDAHHTFEIVCRMDVLEKHSTEVAQETKNFLGGPITLQIDALDAFEGYRKLEFKGIVTQVKNVKGYNQHAGDTVIITGKSPTFLADDGPHYASHNEVSISEIIEKTFREYDGSKLELQIEPVNDDTIYYTVQHKESCYAYASRLAAQYGEWFYYNGKKLVFGKPETDELELTYGFDLKEYHLSLMPKSHNYKFYSKDYLLDELHEKDSKEVSSESNNYTGFVSNKANEIYNKETKVWHNLYVDPKSKSRLDKSIELQKKAIEIQQVKVTGVSDNPGVALGNIVKVEGGRYRVINVTHSNNENGDYQNRFEAITAEFDAYPNTNIEAYPISRSQAAIVVDNADTEGLGRIKVQFPWQKDMGEMTPWIRIVTSHAGGDKGFQFIPEIDEEVLIDFEGGNAEKPYMLGSLYHGSAKPDSWKTDKNDIKAIRTRSGHTVEFNDEDGAETIKIYDNDGSIIIFDTQAKSLTINATETIDIAAKNINIVAEEDVNIQAKGTINTASEGDTNILSDSNTNIQTKQDTSITSKGEIAVEATKDTSVKGMNLKLEGKTNAELKGTQTNIKGQVTAVQGASSKIDIV